MNFIFSWYKQYFTQFHQFTSSRHRVIPSIHFRIKGLADVERTRRCRRYHRAGQEDAEPRHGAGQRRHHGESASGRCYGNVHPGGSAAHEKDHQEERCGEEVQRGQGWGWQGGGEGAGAVKLQPERGAQGAGGLHTEAQSARWELSPKKQGAEEFNQPTDGTANRPTERPTDRPTERPTERPTDRPNDQLTDRPTERPTDRSTDLKDEFLRIISTSPPYVVPPPGIM